MFIVTPQDITAQVGEDIEFECITNTGSDVQWERIGHMSLPISSSILNNGALKITKIEEYFGGTYCCSNGNLSTMVTLKVVGMLTIDSIECVGIYCVYAVGVYNYNFVVLITVSIYTCVHPSVHVHVCVYMYVSASVCMCFSTCTFCDIITLLCGLCNYMYVCTCTFRHQCVCVSLHVCSVI